MKALDLKSKIKWLQEVCWKLIERDEIWEKKSYLGSIEKLKATLWETLDIEHNLTAEYAAYINHVTQKENDLEEKSSSTLIKNSQESWSVVMKHHEDIIGYCSSQKYEYEGTDIYEFGTLWIDPERRGLWLSKKIQQLYIENFLQDTPYYLVTTSPKVKNTAYLLWMSAFKEEDISWTDLETVVELWWTIHWHTIFLNDQLHEIFIWSEKKHDTA